MSKQKVLEFIKSHIRQHGVSPSYEVIAKGVGMSSKSNIHRIVHRLRDEGLLDLKPYKFHSIRLVDRSVQEISRL
jgi:SOS-response transcriptional repressor LexA